MYVKMQDSAKLEIERFQDVLRVLLSFKLSTCIALKKLLKLVN